MKTLCVLALAAFLAACGNSSPDTLAGRDAAGKAGDARVVVAVLDTGIRATHETFAPGQITAWYDFGRPGRPAAPDTLWDPDVAPYDEAGHGTAVASMVAGRSGRQTFSYAPGIELVVAKITGPDGTATWADVADAMRWAREIGGADIVSLSFYGYLPQVASPVTSS